MVPATIPDLPDSSARQEREPCASAHEHLVWQVLLKG